MDEVLAAVIQLYEGSLGYRKLKRCLKRCGQKKIRFEFEYQRYFWRAPISIFIRPNAIQLDSVSRS